MAIVYEEDWRARRLNRTIDDKGVQQWTADRAWDVVVAPSETAALNAVREAQLLASHDQSPTMRVQTNNATRTGFGVIRVGASYTIPTLANSNSDPLLAPPEFSFTGSEDMQDTDRDVNGNAILNSAGEAFESGAQYPLKTFIYTVSLNQPFYDGNQTASLLNALCDGTFRTPFGAFKRGEVLFYDCLPAAPFRLMDRYVRVNYMFKIRLAANFPNMPKGASPFDIRFLDQGLNARCTTIPGKKFTWAHIVDGTGTLVSQNVRLNSRGTPVEKTYNVRNAIGSKPALTLASVNPPKACKVEESPGTDAKAFFLWYQIYRYENFGKLNSLTSGGANNG